MANASYYITDNNASIHWEIQENGNGTVIIKGSKGFIIKTNFEGAYRKMQKDYVSVRASYIHEFKNPVTLNFEYNKTQTIEVTMKELIRDALVNSQTSEVEAISNDYDIAVKFDVLCSSKLLNSMASTCDGKINFQVVFDLF